MNRAEAASNRERAQRQYADNAELERLDEQRVIQDQRCPRLLTETHRNPPPSGLTEPAYVTHRRCTLGRNHSGHHEWGEEVRA